MVQLLLPTGEVGDGKHLGKGFGVYAEAARFATIIRVWQKERHVVIATVSGRNDVS